MYLLLQKSLLYEKEKVQNGCMINPSTLIVNFVNKSSVKCSYFQTLSDLEASISTGGHKNIRFLFIMFQWKQQAFGKNNLKFIGLISC